ncbi:MAG: nicotinate-nucleotide adenylyltransferase [Gammaproteobacteria bacterium]|nr:nicotinate-nucleotide adenylyltransferase [Gammaproteobacteria bacterium]MDH3412090.1 nicotinate-nucleotide adenylyltransferase [Gammaproteobacteria bacterium]
MNPIGILGGTFDPVHNGHLRLAIEMREALGLSSVKLIPASVPPLRNAPDIDASKRLRMLEAAIEGEEGLEIDDCELHRKGTSYTVDTLRSIRKDVGDTPLCLIVGMDAFRRFDQWHQWEKLLDLAHIAVAHRPGSEAPESGAVAEFVKARRVDDPERLRERGAGYVIVRNIPALDISATRIRALLSTGQSIRYLVPDQVHDILIKGEQLHA